MTIPTAPAMSRFRTALLVGALVSAAGLTPSDASAQIRASEIGTVSQVVDGTRLTVAYSRPRARGREKLFGTKAVQWNEVWTPGANYATTLETSHDVHLNGTRVPKGKYSVWFVVKETGDWTFVLDPRVKLFHMEHPDSTAQQIRFPVKVTQEPAMETLTWWFPSFSARGTTLAMQWGTYRVTADVRVAPTLSDKTPATVASEYVGRYRYVDKFAKDSLSTLTLSYEDGVLRGQFTPEDPYMKKFAMIRVGPDLFVPGLYDAQGEIYEVMRPDMLYTFKRAGGKIVGLELRYDDDTLGGVATRIP